MYAPAHREQTKALSKGSLNRQFLSLRFTLLDDIEDFDMPCACGSLPSYQCAGYYCKINGLCAEGEGSNVNEDASPSSDWHLNSLPKYKRAQQQQQLGLALEVSSCRWY